MGEELTVAIFEGTQEAGFFAPQRFEGVIEDCEVVGTIPADLDGAFVRVGGEFYYPPKFPNDAPLHSDGYISKFRFKDGRVSYQGKFVRTAPVRRRHSGGAQPVWPVSQPLHQ